MRSAHVDQNKDYVVKNYIDDHQKGVLFTEYFNEEEKQIWAKKISLKIVQEYCNLQQ